MKGHELFEHIQRMKDGEYKSTLDDTEYYLKLSDPETQYPWIGISYNDVRNYWGLSDDQNFEKEGECISCNKRTGHLYYHRLKEHVSSLLIPSYKLAVDRGPIEFKSPYPKPMEQLLDRTLKLFKTADKI